MNAPAFQYYAGDCFIDTFLWSNRELGAYWRLLSFEWVNGPLPKDLKNLGKIAMESPENMARIWVKIRHKFEENDEGLLVNLRLEETREKQRKYSESRRKGAEAKHKKDVHMQKSCSDNLTGLCTPSSSSSSSSTHKDKKIYTSDSPEYGLAELLFSLMRVNNPNVKEPNMQVWAKDFDFIMRVDGRDHGKVKELVEWSQGDQFWMKNILSPAKLRKQFDRLTLEMNSRAGTQKKDPIWD